MNCNFKRKLPVPMEIKGIYPLTYEMEEARKKRTIEIKKILSGELNKLLLIIGPCSADNEDSIMDYVARLRKVHDKVFEKICIIPRIYTNKPRTTCDGYKGMLHHPDPMSESDMLRGLTQIRKIHMRALQETGLTCADEMLYPENHRYLSDLLAYVAVGARSVENQQHRLTASALDIPVGMKNPTSGDLSIMFNSIKAAQNPHTFIYRGWEVDSKGNPFAHAILRGGTSSKGNAESNYHYETLVHVHEDYLKHGLRKPAVIIDTNHANSDKKYLEQIRISKDVMHSRKQNKDIEKLVKGLMIESYIEDGSQKPEENIYGKSITDSCLGWKKAERLIYDLAELV